MADGAGTPRVTSLGGIAGLDPRLMLWLSPSFPVGAFAFSHGLEQAAARGWLPDAAALEAWLRDLVQNGSAHNDLIVLASAWRAVHSGNMGALREANGLALVMQSATERHLETVTQGNAFASAILAAWPCSALEAARVVLPGDVAYPVIVGAAAAAHGIVCEATLIAFGLAFASGLVSAAIRLSVIGQTDAQKVLARLLPDIEAAARAASTSSLADLGSATFRSDIAQLAHETQYSRLFRS